MASRTAMHYEQNVDDEIKFWERTEGAEIPPKMNGDCNEHGDADDLVEYLRKEMEIHDGNKHDEQSDVEIKFFHGQHSFVV